MKNSEYWQERFRQLEEAQNRLAQISFKEIEAQYRAAQKELEGKINTWYQRLAKNNNVSMAEARKLLSANELEEFKWSVWDYIKHGEKNALDGQWIKQLENASAKFHISKYQALMIDTRQSFEQMFGKQLGTVTDTMGKVFENGYYKTAYELQKGMGIGFDVGKINRDEVEKVLSKPWAADGKNFSERIWGNKEKLINEVHTQLTQNIITGADPQKAIDAIAKKMNTSKSNAGRLVMTEEAFFSAVAQGKSYRETGLKKYKILATLDSLTSEICRDLDGKVFDTKDFQPGVTANPFHVNCRSTTCPYFDDDFGKTGERAASDKDGKTYYVPSDMTYREWEKGFVDGDKSGFVSRDEREGQESKDKGQEPVKDFWKETNNSDKTSVDKYDENGIIKENNTNNLRTNMTQSTPTIIRQHQKETLDVTDEYIKVATPKIGTVIYDDEYRVSKHKDEIKTANWLLTTFGGNIRLLAESTIRNQNTPDYLWNGKYWELKSTHSINGADKLLQHAIKQIRDNPGGVILDLLDDLDISKLEKQLVGRFLRSELYTLDIMLLQKGVLLKIIRHKK